ncbi:uncharacterized protein RHO25_010089 [Cercospora beticola]|uniref:Bola-like protein n=1 Tax=Cercospora beticola TaxID=122368 RepID=A0ABZ0P0Q8_CERBT|nr:hypothetical protein RHO25_010089 [Cercospora beticola]CAK1365242.1 unnamed protein product [Cercospora beticola]
MASRRLATQLLRASPRQNLTSQLRTSFPPARLQQQQQPKHLFSTTSTLRNSTPQPPEYLDANERRIFDLLVQDLSPTKLEVQDISGGCGSMYALDIVSEAFKGLPVIKQHRLVNKVLGEEIKKWHGVQLKTKAP